MRCFISRFILYLAWNRILPTGVAPINKEAVTYYNDLIDTLLDNGIEPHVTIYHSETPLALTLYPYNPQPFLDSEKFPAWFANYSDVLFTEFGDRVKHWFTFNEPWCTAVFGATGPEDPYMVAHNAILAHAEAVNLYRSKYVSSQKGTIGIVLNSMHFYPKDASSPADIAAAQRAYGKLTEMWNLKYLFLLSDFQYGWFLDPMLKGEYPATMRDTVGDRLPRFTNEQKKKVLGSLDFVAINYYFPYITSA
jgi:beta-glucosidase